MMPKTPSGIESQYKVGSNREDTGDQLEVFQVHPTSCPRKEHLTSLVDEWCGVRSSVPIKHTCGCNNQKSISLQINPFEKNTYV